MSTRWGWLVGLLVWNAAGALLAQEPATNEEELVQPWLEPIPTPADPELEEQIHEVQDALDAINRQIVRRKDAVIKTEDAAAKAKLYEELDLLRRERNELASLLNDLVEEARVSERTAIDEALARARWLERQQEQWYQKEELIRDRKE